ncbi:MAG: zinc ABC transporter substrate-binding protein [Sulfurovum sp.]
MKKIITTLTLSFTYIFALNATVSIMPEKEFLQAIGGDKINISLMVKAGDSPHTYEPKPSQMVDISKSDIYFSIGVEFENVWLPKFANLNPKMQIVDISKDIEKIAMQKHEEHKDHDDHDEHNHGALDPHIWTSIANIKIIVQNIYNALSELEPQHREYFKANLDRYIAVLEKTNKNIEDSLSSLLANRVFMVFHPSWGYFARDYNLTQLAVEVEGKSPKPRELIYLIKEAKEERVRAIFTQPEFSDTISKVIATELNIPVVKVSPLAPKILDTLATIAKIIAKSK